MAQRDSTPGSTPDESVSVPASSTPAEGIVDGTPAAREHAVSAAVGDARDTTPDHTSDLEDEDATDEESTPENMASGERVAQAKYRIESEGARDGASAAMSKILFRAASITALAIIGGTIGLLVLMFVAKLTVFTVSGSSMEPTLSHSDTVLLKQSAEVEDGEIVLFTKPSKWSAYDPQSDALLVKRIAAVPGDVLEFDGEKFMVNGETVYTLSDDDYECKDGNPEYVHQLEMNEIFVLGDNAKQSLDSRRIFCDGDAENMYVSNKEAKDWGQIRAVF